MSALLAGPMGWLAALGLVLLLGIAARRTVDRARGSSRRREARAQVAMDERIRARIEATIWPD